MHRKLLSKIVIKIARPNFGSWYVQKQG